MSTGLKAWGKLGETYKNDLACSTFIDLIRQKLHENFQEAKHTIYLLSNTM